MLNVTELFNSNQVSKKLIENQLSNKLLFLVENLDKVLNLLDIMDVKSESFSQKENFLQNEKIESLSDKIDYLSEKLTIFSKKLETSPLLKKINIKNNQKSNYSFLSRDPNAIIPEYTDTSIIQINVTRGLVENIYNSLEDLKSKYPRFNVEEIEKCIEQKLTIYSFGWLFGKDYKEINIKEYSKTRSFKRLLVNEFKEIVAEIAPHPDNIGLDISKLAYASEKQITFCCLKNNTHPNYTTVVSAKTKILPFLNFLGCKRCHLDSIRIYDKDKIDEHIKNYIPGLDKTAEVGDNSEKYIVEILKTISEFVNIERTGQTGEKCDIKITLANGQQKSLQVKTLTYSQIEDRHYLDNSKLYKSDMLLCAISKDRKFYLLAPAGKLDGGKVTICFNNISKSRSKYKKFMFDNIDNFIEALKTEVPKSCDYELILAPKNQLEYNMFINLEEFCNSNNWVYRRNDTNSNTIDCYINDIPIQCKFISLNSSKNSYNIPMRKCFGRCKEKRVKKSYDSTDPFEYVIVAIGTILSKDDKLKFCVIPKYELINQKILALNVTDGLKSMSICKPDFEQEHWSKKYWEISRIRSYFNKGDLKSK